MIHSRYSKEKFKQILDGLENNLGRTHISNRVLNDNLRVIDKYNHDELEFLIRGIQDKKLSAPHSWLETLIYLNNNDGIYFVEKLPEENLYLVEPEPTEISKNIPLASNSEISNCSWVWFSNEESISLKKISILSILETIFAVGLYGWLAFYFQHQWWLIISAVAAPVILMRSDTSITEGLLSLRKYWLRESEDAKKTESYLILFVVSIFILAVIYLVKDKIISEQNNVHLIAFGIGFSCIIITLCGAIMGAVNATIIVTFRTIMPGMGISFSMILGSLSGGILSIFLSFLIPIVVYIYDQVQDTYFIHYALYICVGTFIFSLIATIIIIIPLFIMLEGSKTDSEFKDVSGRLLSKWFYPVYYAITIIGSVFFIYLINDIYLVDYISQWIDDRNIRQQQDSIVFIEEIFGEAPANNFSHVIQTLSNISNEETSGFKIEYIVSFVALTISGIFLYAIVILLSSGITTNNKLEPSVTADWILTPVFVFSIWLRTIFIRIYYSIRHPIKGLMAFPENWKDILLRIDFFHSPELIPGAKRITPHLTAEGLFDEAIARYEDKTNRKHIKFYATLSVIIYLTAFLWRWGLKSTLWLWWPLSTLLKSPFYGKRAMEINDISAVRVYGLGKWLPSLAAIVMLWLISGYLPAEEVKFWSEVLGDNSSKILNKLLTLTPPPPLGLRQLSLWIICILTIIIWWLSDRFKIMHKKVLEEEDALDGLSEERRDLFIQRARHLERWHTARIVSFIFVGYSHALYLANEWYHQETSRFIPNWLISWL